MRRRQIILDRAELRRTLNTEQAVAPPVPEEPPVPQEHPAPKRRGRPPKVKHDNISGSAGQGGGSTREG